MSKRYIISVGTILALIILAQFGEAFVNGFLAFLLTGAITGTDLALPSLVMLSCMLLALTAMVFWVIRASKVYTQS